MILVAATAAGLALTRLYYPSLAREETFLSPVRPYGWFASRLPSRRELAGLNLPLATWTLALFVFQWRPPRPSRRRLVRQPGFAVNLAATVGLTLWAIAWSRSAWIELIQQDGLEPQAVSLFFTCSKRWRITRCRRSPRPGSR